jgi:hypothetical protein
MRGRRLASWMLANWRASRSSPGTVHLSDAGTSARLGNDDFLFSLAQAVIGPAIYDDVPESIEDFEEGWSQNESFIRELASAEAADFDPGPGTKLAEDFDGLWAFNEGFLFAFAPADLTGIPTESFEAGWRGNGSFLFSFDPSDVSAASYDTAGSAEAVEDFEGLWPNLVMTTL